LYFRRLLGFIKKDIKLFAVDRQAVVMSLVVPILIASILGWLDSTATGGSQASPITIDVVDLDQSDISQAVIDRLSKSGTVRPDVVSKDQALKDVRQAKVTAAIILPKRFGKVAYAALIGGTKPKIDMITDPSRPIESQIVMGALLEQGSSAVMGMTSDTASAPFKVLESHAERRSTGSWANAAHDYAGFGLQGLLFFAMEAAIGLARERKMGIWQRLRAAPVPLGLILLSREVSSTIMALAIIVAMFGFGALLFGIRILGSSLGFALVSVSTALMAATFGLLIATVGKTETQSRGLSILLIMVMLATGGAWFPMAKMPTFVQTVANWLPVRWAVEGFDAMTWRGMGLNEALRSSSALIAFAGVFAALALVRFRWAGYRE